MDQNDRVLAYLQGRLSDEDRLAFEGDISRNAELASEVAAMRGARAAMIPQDVPDKSEGWEKISAAIDKETFQPANQNRPIRLSLLQTAASVVLAVFLWQSLATPYLTSGSYFSPASEAISAPILQVVFTDNATISDISALLNDLNASIISGPGAIGIYQIAFPDDDSLKSAKAILETREDLVARVFVK